MLDLNQIRNSLKSGQKKSQWINDEKKNKINELIPTHNLNQIAEIMYNTYGGRSRMWVRERCKMYMKRLIEKMSEE